MKVECRRKCKSKRDEKNFRVLDLVKGPHPRSYVEVRCRSLGATKRPRWGKEPAQVKVLEDGGERTGGKQVAHPPVSPRLGALLLPFWCLRTPCGSSKGRNTIEGKVSLFTSLT